MKRKVFRFFIKTRKCCNSLPTPESPLERAGGVPPLGTGQRREVALLRNVFINPIERISFVEEYAGITLEGTNTDAGRDNVVVWYF
jgi:hypothetical protein